MTFEEFFIKKKIDLVELKQGDPGLFSELKSHFELMGAKSFDHTKKFWFNKLRRAYHLTEAPKPGKEVIVTEQTSQVELLSSLTIDQMPFEKPILNAEEFSEEPKIQTDGIKTSTLPKFTPRNIIAKPQGTPTGENTVEQATRNEATKAVGFKPRFKPKTAEKTKTSQEAEASDHEAESLSETLPQPEKPAYKPKFNLKNIPKQVEAETSQNDTSSQEEPTAVENATAEEKPAYKPKFNLKNIPKKTETPEAEKEESGGESTGKPEEKSAEPAPKEEAKFAYKPRFNMKNIRPKSDE